MKTPMKPTNMIITAVLAFLCTAAFKEYSVMAEQVKNEEELFAKKNDAIVCSPGAVHANDIQSHDLPGDKPKGCAHQSACGFLYIRESKRSKAHNC
jgi:hypothetical protein